jgi:hypothetical protein
VVKFIVLIFCKIFFVFLLSYFTLFLSSLLVLESSFLGQICVLALPLFLVPSTPLSLEIISNDTENHLIPLVWHLFGHARILFERGSPRISQISAFRKRKLLPGRPWRTQTFAGSLRISETEHPRFYIGEFLDKAPDNGQSLQSRKCARSMRMITHKMF